MMDEISRLEKRQDRTKRRRALGRPAVMSFFQPCRLVSYFSFLHFTSLMVRRLLRTHPMCTDAHRLSSEVFLNSRRYSRRFITNQRDVTSSCRGARLMLCGRGDGRQCYFIYDFFSCNFRVDLLIIFFSFTLTIKTSFLASTTKIMRSKRMHISSNSFHHHLVRARL